MEQPKVGVFLSDCGKQLSEILDFDALTSFVKTVPNVALIASCSEFWRDKGLQSIVKAGANLFETGFKLITCLVPYVTSEVNSATRAYQKE
jgi:hypothetical protein